MSIDHAAEAQKHIDWAHGQQEVDGSFDFTVRDNALIAQAEATLAMVVALIDRLEKAEARVKELRDKHRQTFTALVAAEGRAEKAEERIADALVLVSDIYEADGQNVEDLAHDLRETLEGREHGA